MLAKKVVLKFERTKVHCNIGTIGHVDHGKTTLTAAITKCLQGIGSTIFKAYSDIDNCSEERQRGITINAAHVEYETEKRHYSHIDCPGHQQYVKNMLTGAAQMEGAILVVAVNDGPQVQTREHIILAKEVGIRYIVVYINKLDFKLSSDMRELVELEIRELLESYKYPDSLPVLGGSARLALEETEYTDLGMKSVQELMNTVDTYIEQPERKLDAPFLLSVESVLKAKGRGTVVTGKVEQGVISINDELELLSSEAQTITCAGLEMFRRTLERAEVGDNIGILIRGLKKELLVTRGNVLATPGSIKVYNSFFGKVYILTKKEGGRHKGFSTNYKPQFFFRTMNVTGAIILPENVLVVLPGDNLIFKVNLVSVAPLNVGLRFVMREGNLTIGAGIITEL